MDYKTKDTFIELTDDQEKELLFASKEGKKGQVTSQSEMDEKVEGYFVLRDFRGPNTHSEGLDCRQKS